MADPRPVPAPARPEEPELQDEAGLDPAELEALPAPTAGGPRPSPARAEPLPEEPEEDDEEVSLLPVPAAPEAPAEEGEEDLLDEALAGGGPPGEAARALDWLQDDGLRTTDEEDLLPATGRADVLVAGNEETVTLLDLGGVSLPATLATGIVGSVLSGPLERLEGGQVRLRVGAEIIQADPRAFATRVKLGPVVLDLLLRLVEGPGPRLVIGRDALAGLFLVDPAGRELLSPPVPARREG